MANGYYIWGYRIHYVKYIINHIFGIIINTKI